MLIQKYQRVDNTLENNVRRSINHINKLMQSALLFSLLLITLSGCGGSPTEPDDANNPDGLSNQDSANDQGGTDNQDDDTPQYALESPKNLIAPFPAGNGAYVTWDKVDGAESYQILSGDTLIETTAKNYSYKLRYAEPGTKYDISVTALGPTGDSAPAILNVTTTQPVNAEYHFPDGVPYPWVLDSDGFIDRRSLVVTGSSNQTENTIVRYVSSSGDDNSTGDHPDRTWATPKRAIEYLVTQTENGQTPSSIHILFKRGDQFNIEKDDFLLQYIQGVSPENPIFIGAYGAGNRPKFVPTTYDGNGIRTAANRPDGTPKHIIIQGLDFHHMLRDPNSSQWVNTLGFVEAQKTSMAFNTEAQWLIIEDCRFQYFGGGRGASMLDENLLNPQSRPEYILLRRNIVRYNWGNQSLSHSQGFLTKWAHNIVLEENLFDHNAWLSDPLNRNFPHPSTPNAYPNTFSHELYLQYTPYDIVVRNNIVSRASDIAIMARSGGHIYNNLILSSPVGIMISNAGEVVNNTILYSRDIISVDKSSADYKDNNYLDSYDTNNYTRQRHGWGIQSLWYSKALIKHNIVAHKSDDVEGPGFAFHFSEGEPGIENSTLGTSIHKSEVDLVENVAFNFGRGIWIYDFSTVRANRNVISASMDTMAVRYHKLAPDYKTQHTWNNNYYNTESDSSLIMNYDQETTTACSDSQSLLSDTNSLCISKFSDSARDIESYQIARGKPSNLESFLDDVANREGGIYNPELDVKNIQNYLRAGFNNAIFSFEK